MRPNIHLISLCLLYLLSFSCSCNSKDSDCNKMKINPDLLSFTIENLDFQNEKYSSLLINETLNPNRQIDVILTQNEDTLTIDFLRLDGDSKIDCANIDKSNGKIYLRIYESNYAKELTLKQFLFRILHDGDITEEDIQFQYIGSTR